MKPLVSLILLCGLQPLIAQHFIESVQSPPLEGVFRNALAFVDVDSDEDQDLFLVGQTNAGVSTSVAKLYLNDGNATFTEVMGTPFVAVNYADAAVADVDGDDDLDVLLAGYLDSAQTVTKLYLNDGMGTFSEAVGPTFEGVGSCSVAFADVDGDTDPDVILNGWNGQERIAKLYLNEGNLSFVEVMGIPFQGLTESDIATVDVNGDEAIDVFLCGSNGAERVSALYLNDGDGNFSEVLNTPFIGVVRGAVAHADVDGDGDPDLLIAGEESASIFPPDAVEIAKLYLNDGTGTFLEVSGSPFAGVSYCSLGFADVDGDQDPDLLLSGVQSMVPMTRLYLNDGMGNFSEMMDTPFEGRFYGSLALSDVDGDQDTDMLLTGSVGIPVATSVTTLYLNEAALSVADAPLLAKLAVYPNPVSGEVLHIRFRSDQVESLSVHLLDALGRVHLVKYLPVVLGEQTLPLEIGALPVGGYYLRIIQGNEVMQTIFLVTK